MIDVTNALPAYPGGKRRIARGVFALLREELPQTAWKDATFADAFLGAGSVALYAKVFGFQQVLANDIAERSQLIGRAVIANSSVKIADRAALELLITADGCPPPLRIFDRLMPTTRRFFSSCWLHLRDHEAGVERDLLALLCSKLLLRCFPMSLAGATDAPHAAGGDFDRISNARLGHYVRSAGTTTPTAVLTAARQINDAVMPGSGQIFGLDAFEFLARAGADVVYLDPPYGGTQSYEKAFEFVDEFLGSAPLPPSAFSSGTPPLDDLLDACCNIPVLVMSMNNSLLDAEGVSALVRRHRRLVRLVAMPYRHYGAIASAAKNATNVEFLALGVRDGA